MSEENIHPGDIYEDSAYHPCLCIGADGYEIWGVSLIDGSYPRCEDIRFSGVRKLTPEQAWIWRTQGPPDAESELPGRWWDDRIKEEASKETTLLSEAVLAKDWDRSDEDEAWSHLQQDSL